MIRQAMTALFITMLAGALAAQTTAPATSATTAPAGSVKLEDVLAKLPADLKPTVGETAEHKAARDAWFKNELGDKALRITMQVAGIYLDIEPRSLNGFIAPNINLDAQIEKGATVDPVKMGDDVTIEGTQAKITIVPSGRTTVLVHSVHVLSVKPKK